jgi:hypothetical protein
VAGSGWRRIDATLVAGLVVVVGGAAVLRVVHLGANLPAIVAPDEPTVVDRAVGLLHGRLPTEYDWPSASMLLLAGVFRVIGHAGSYLLSRAVFVAVSLAVVALTGAVGAAMADHGGGRTARRLTAWGASSLVAVSYLSVRLGRLAHPDHLQLDFVLGAFLCIAVHDRRDEGDWRWLGAAGLLAGLAAATKYLGGLVIIPAAMSVLWRPWDARRATRHLGLLVAAAAAGFVAGVPAVVVHGGRVVEGVRFQFGHQSGGHLGYDGVDHAWWFHLTRSLPGNWGWPVTVLALAGLAWAVWRGTRLQRMAAVHVAVTFAVVGSSDVRFPHYALLVVPFLAAFAVVAALRIAPRVRTAPVVTLGLVGALLWPSLLDDLRLVRAAAAVDTRTLAAAAVSRLPPGSPVVTERYGVPSPPAVGVPDIGSRPDLVGCRCFVVVSSYMEERYRREPRRYAAQVAVYDAVRRRGRVVATFAPSPRLAYDWDVLPGWGIDRIPLRGPVGPVGPTVTIIDLRSVGRPTAG